MYGISDHCKFFNKEEDLLRVLAMFLALFFLLAPAMSFADDENSAKEGINEVHEGMKKVAKTVDKNAKKTWKAVDKKAKQDWKTVDKNAKKTWKKAGQDVQKASKD